MNRSRAKIDEDRRIGNNILDTVALTPVKPLPTTLREAVIYFADLDTCVAYLASER